MNTAKDPFFASIQLGAPQAYRNIVVFPITAPSHRAARWLTLGDALEQQVLTVTEISHGGSVPELAVINRADCPVLLLDGEELIGAKQNRVLNTTILLKENIISKDCAQRQGRTLRLTDASRIHSSGLAGRRSARYVAPNRYTHRPGPSRPAASRQCTT